MALIDKETLDISYETWLEAHDDIYKVDMLIKYETNDGVWDEVNQTFTSQPVEHTLQVKANYKEIKRLGDITSSSIISPDSVPTGNFYVYLYFEDRLNVSSIANYVNKSLRFILYPNTIYEMTLYPKLSTVKDVFLDNRIEYPMEQRFECSIIQEGN